MAQKLKGDSQVSNYLAEFLGTFLIVTTVAGSGFMMTDLGILPGVDLAIIAASVGLVLFVVISLFIAISGAHFNPVVTIALGIRKQISARIGVIYIVMQLFGAFAGAVVANLMFGRDVVAAGVVQRISPETFIGEIVATAGLLLIVLLLVDQGKLSLIAPSVGAWVAAGHIFTSSTSFANPAVTFGRAFIDGITGIEIASVPGFVIAQLVGAAVALTLFFFLSTKKEQNV
jgi:glycerol uptake facilitator-like aquaporin